MKEVKRILITVKTYPLPSSSYKETVCTAGVLEDGSFIRLYPISFRYLNEGLQFKKYQWIEAEVERTEKDSRPESHRLYPDTLKIVSDVLPTRNFWEARSQFVLKKPINTMCELQRMGRTECSLGIIKPSKIVDFTVDYDGNEWKGKQKAARERLWLDGHLKELLKVPFVFRYKYFCKEPGCLGHHQMIEDWELGSLFFKRCKEVGEEQAVADVRNKFFNDICGQDKNTYFFVGMVSSYKSWVVLGTYYPKNAPVQQGKLPM